MSERIDSYLAEIDRLLKRQMPEKLRLERIAEMRGHLHLSSRDLIDGGVAAEDAEKESLRNLGAAREVAENLIRQQCGYSRRSAWMLALFPILLTLSSQAFLFVYLPGVPWWENYWIPIMRWAGVPVYLAFAWQVWRTRRWLVAPLSVASVALIVFAAIYMHPDAALYQVGEVSFVAPSHSLADYRQALHDKLTTMKSDVSSAQHIYSEVLKGGHSPKGRDGFLIPSTSQTHHNMSLPGTLVQPSFWGRPVWFMQSFPYVDQEGADKQWRDSGTVAIADMSSQVETLEKAYAHWQDGPPLNLPWIAYTYGLFLLTFAIHVAMLTGLNWLILRLADRSRRGREMQHA